MPRPSFWSCGGGSEVNCTDWDDINGCWRYQTDFTSCPRYRELEEERDEEEDEAW